MSGWLSNLGTGIGSFLGSVTSPVLGSSQTTSTSVTEKPKETNYTVYIIVGVVVIISIAAYFYFKRKKA